MIKVSVLQKIGLDDGEIQKCILQEWLKKLNRYNVGTQEST
jgi:hypothetical protein